MRLVVFAFGLAVVGGMVSASPVRECVGVAVPPQTAGLRALVVHPDEFTDRWVDRAVGLGVDVLGIHPTGGDSADASLERLLRQLEDPVFRARIDVAKRRGLAIEYETHAASWLLPRTLFNAHPEYFRMDAKGRRTAQQNLCVSNPEALKLVCARAVELARRLYGSSHRYYFWLDDAWGDGGCHCPDCAGLSASDQQLLCLNAILASLRREIPDAKLAYLAYHGTMAVPEKVRPSDGIFLEFAPINRDMTKPLAGQDSAEATCIPALLSLFGAKDARVLEYWFDNSFFSKWRKPPKKFAPDSSVIAADMAFYAEKGFSELASFACFLGDDYERLWGEPDLSAFRKGIAHVVPCVDPFVGTSGNGHCTPAATRPFGMVQSGPDTGRGDWHHCSGYRFEEAALYGFSQTHLSGTGGADLGDFRLLPFCGAGLPPVSVPMDKTTERAEPGYYTVTAGGVRTEIAAARRYAVYRFVFPEGVVPRVLFDNTWTLNADGKALTELIEKMRFAPDADQRRFTAYHRVNGWARGRDIYCAAEFSIPWTKMTLVGDGRYVFEFPEREFELRIALSRTDEARARRNLGAADFATIRRGARAEWESLLSRVEAKGSRDELVNLYTALYHLCCQPNDISDEGEKPYYSTFSLWDTFRAAHPLYTELVPERVPGMVDSMLADERKNGYLPIWTLWGVETQCMIGTHSVPVIVDAYLKGLLPQVDTNALMTAIHRTLNWELGRRKDGWPILRRFGFYPQDLVEHESVSRTLECAYDDACAARFAAAIGDRKEEEIFRKRAENWRNVFDAKTGFMRPRNLDGAFVEPFSPFRQGYGSGFTEGNSWQYTWHVLHEPEALMNALGGKAAFCDKLEGLFRQPEKVDGMEVVADATGLIGQYAHGNEPSHHVAFLFALAGRPERTDALVREICTKFYRPTPDGLCGNDDCGQMSAWYVYACLGRYPLDPCGGRFVTFVPFMKECKLR